MALKVKWLIRKFGTQWYLALMLDKHFCTERYAFASFQDAVLYMYERDVWWMRK